MSLEEVRAAIAAIFSDVRDSDHDGNPFESSEEDVVETYKPGKYAPMSSQATAEWAYDVIQADVHAHTTDERIAELVDVYEAEANSNGYTLDGDLLHLMLEHRKQLRDQQKEEA